MCGLCGEFRTDGAAPDHAAVERMRDVLAPRGPDDAGFHAQGSAAFGHRRLKVMDLSDASHQPMVDEGLGLAVVFNGALYNHPELRETLREQGYAFSSQGDTEVLLKAFHAWGEDAVTRFQGMFAFAVHDLRDGSLTLGRDRLGIKPLYCADVPGGLRFASTLPALLAGGGIDPDIDPQALLHYMTFHSVVPAPRTLLRGVRKLEPATLLRVERDGRRRSRSYWTLRYGPRDDETRLDAAEWTERVLAALRTAVRRRLVAEVPVGVLLSGGVDSSLIVGLLAEMGQEDLKTFSIGFESAGGESGDEFKWSDLVAERFATDHRRLRISTRGILDDIAPCVAAMAEPMVSHDNIGFFLLSREVSKHVKVVQSGQGADEVFGGYHWYPPMLETVDPVAAYARVFFDRDHAEARRVLHPRFQAAAPAEDFVAARFARPGAPRAVDKALRLDTTVMLVDDPVKRVDNMTMAFGLEARVPFLDHDLVELAARVPAELKVGRGGKHVLKEAARQVIPAAVIDRPKGYFPVPALKHLAGETLDFVRSVVDGEGARRRGLFDRAYVETLLAEPRRHLTPLGGSKLWQIALLELWLDTHLR